MEAVARENDPPNHCDINEEVPANENPTHGLQGKAFQLNGKL